MSRFLLFFFLSAFLFSFEVEELDLDFKLSQQVKMSKADVVSLMQYLCSHNKILCSELTEKDVHLDNRGLQFDTAEMIRVNLKKTYLIKRLKNEDHLQKFANLLNQEDIVRYQKAAVGNIKLPKLVLPIYMCKCSKHDKPVYLVIQEYMAGMDLIACLRAHKKNLLNSEELFTIFKAFGSGFAQFQNYFLDENKMTRRHGDPSFLNILSVENKPSQICFLDLVGMECPVIKAYPKEEIYRILTLSVFQYFRRDLSHKGLVALEVFFEAFLSGYLCEINENLYQDAVIGVNETVNKIVKNYPKFRAILRGVMSRIGI